MLACNNVTVSHSIYVVHRCQLILFRIGAPRGQALRRSKVSLMPFTGEIRFWAGTKFATNNILYWAVAQLKNTAANVKSSGSDRFQNIRAKYTGLSSANSSYNSWDSTTKAPPPPQRDEENEIPEEVSQEAGPPPPPVRRSTRPDALISRPPAIKRGVPESIKWSHLSPNDKAVFFGWLDDYFGAMGTSTGVNKVRCFNRFHSLSLWLIYITMVRVAFHQQRQTVSR